MRSLQAESLGRHSSQPCQGAQAGGLGDPSLAQTNLSPSCLMSPGGQKLGEGAQFQAKHSEGSVPTPAGSESSKPGDSTVTHFHVLD